MLSSDEFASRLPQAPGLTLAELLAKQPELSRRSAQRKIAQGLEKNQIQAQGQGRARRYWRATLASTTPSVHLKSIAGPLPRLTCPHGGPDDADATTGGLANSELRLSADSQDVVAYVMQEISARQPVGYQRDFLESYRPNQTAYLPQALRQQLHYMGRTSAILAPAGTYSRAILSRLLIDLSWASSHLEGNTYTRLDTRELLEHGRAAQGKPALETQMILNHKAAIELLLAPPDDAVRVPGFDRYTLFNLHSALSENLLPNPADEGRIRQHMVEIGACVYRPLAVPALIEELLTLLLHKAQSITDPFEQSFFIMVHLPYLQPFADVNKRSARLLANLPLFHANLCPLTFLDVPKLRYTQAMLGVYELTRVELLRDLFVWAYERSTREYVAIQQNMVQPDPLRLRYRNVIAQTIAHVVRHPAHDSLALIEASCAEQVLEGDRVEVRALIIDALRRLHEGVLARYGLRPSELRVWQERGGQVHW
jgi:fido (protein-threonine AMPylation protein)